MISRHLHGVLRVTLQLLAQGARARGGIPLDAWVSPRALAVAQGYEIEPTLEGPGARIDGGVLRYRWEADGSHDVEILRALARYELAKVTRDPTPEVIDLLAGLLLVPPALEPFGPVAARGPGVRGTAQADVLFLSAVEFRQRAS